VKLSKEYAICVNWDDFYCTGEVEEDIYPGFCSYNCEENRDGSCYCSATNNPPCSWCEGSIGAEHDMIGTRNDIFLWSFDLNYERL
jgi:hypothetical protein